MTLIAGLPSARDLAFSLVLLILLASPVRADPLRIGRITIHTGDVFSDAEVASGRLYALADRLHRETRPTVIREFLLFREGDVFDPARLQETERNLRALRFLRSASVRASEPHEGLVDVTVTTADTWSLEPGTSGGSSGGVNTFGFEITEKNIAGTGRSGSLSFHRGVDRSRMMLELTDPAFLRPYLKARAAWARTSDGYERRASVTQPFYSVRTARADEVSYKRWRRDDRIYRAGSVSSVIPHDHEQFLASYGIAPQTTEASATRVTAGVRLLEDRMYDPSLSDPRRRFRYLFFRVDRVNDHFITLTFVDSGIRPQDINLGRRMFAEGAVSPTILGARRTSGFINAGISQGAGFGRSFVLGKAAFESRIDDGLRNAIFSGNVRYVRRFESDLPQTLVGRASVNQGWNLDPERQFFADAESGLRGYRLHAFEGTGNVVVNVEHRVSLGRELFHVASPGVAAFIDAGAPMDRLRPLGWKCDIGAGLRIALTRSSRNLLRLDLAYGLQHDPLGRRGVLISFSTGSGF